MDGQGGFIVTNDIKRLTKEDLKIGMQVTIDQLSGIYGLRILLDSYDDKQGGRIIAFTDKEIDPEVQDAVSRNNNIACTFYQLPEYEDNEVEIYE